MLYYLALPFGSLTHVTLARAVFNWNDRIWILNRSRKLCVFADHINGQSEMIIKVDRMRVYFSTKQGISSLGVYISHHVFHFRNSIVCVSVFIWRQILFLENLISTSSRNENVAPRFSDVCSSHWITFYSVCTRGGRAHTYTPEQRHTQRIPYSPTFPYILQSTELLSLSLPRYMCTHSLLDISRFMRIEYIGRITPPASKQNNRERRNTKENKLKMYTFACFFQVFSLCFCAAFCIFVFASLRYHESKRDRQPCGKSGIERDQCTWRRQFM